ncbi:sulfur reduction protein DsrJ [Thiocapsa sp.]|uniref:sulfur reduction protein DsrJ n=1 Tax=Thiocapsa sp. TaxID=2024551 RepID=UPI0035941D6F
MAKAAVRAGLVAVGLAWVLVAQVVLAADAKTYVVEGSKAAVLESCVEPTDIMRRKHMELIKHQRDETVHGGIRTSKHSLAGCVDCHIRYDADHAPTPIHRKDEFCGACHAFTAVNLNCFDCHASVPKGSAAHAAPQSVGVDRPLQARPDGEDH